MERISQINRKSPMENQYNVADFPKSGFNLTYNSHPAGLIIGRMYPAAYQHIMPSDKFSGRNEFNLIAEQLATPVVSDVVASQHNYFVKYRDIDKGFKDLMTPTKLNGMSASLSAPTFKLTDVMWHLIKVFNLFLPRFTRTNTSADWDFTPSPIVSVDSVFNNLKSSSFGTAMKQFYMDDVLDDLYNQVKSIGYPNITLTLSNLHLLWYAICDFFCGEGSLMDYFGYPIMKHSDVDQWLDIVIRNFENDSAANSSPLTNGNAYDIAHSLSAGEMSWLVGARPSFGTQLYFIDNREVNEYALRAWYAIWFEYYRVNELEPRSNDLWEYHDFGSTPLIQVDANKFVGCLLPLRPRCWNKDPFTTAQIDDICRHVYAPVLDKPDIPEPSFDPQGAKLESTFVFSESPFPAQLSGSYDIYKTGNIWSGVTLQYIDESGVSHEIACPLPQSLSNQINSFSRYEFSAGNLGIDLFSLKKAKMLEQYLKRNFAFGDEYKDRIKAHYGVTIEDANLNIPQYLSGSVHYMDIKQEVANTGAKVGEDNGQVEQGTRLATATMASGDQSDGFEYFSTENGIYINVFSIVPRAQYDYTCPQNFMQKTVDFPTPEFANQQEDIMSNSEMYRLGVMNPLLDNKAFGHVPYAHAYRYRVDEVHGQTLSSKFDYTFCRFYKGLTQDGTPKLNYKFVHCRPNLPMFVNTILLDGQFYGTMKHNFLVERILPQPVETI